MGKFEDKTGKKFEKLLVIEYLGKSKWKCLCDCGKTTVVSTAALTTGKTKSCGCLRQKWHINENFFEKIDTEEKAYVLGLIAADGNLSKTTKNVKIELKYTDEEILEKVKKALDYDFKLIHYNYSSHFNDSKKIYDNHLVRLKNTNKKIYEDLLKYGLTPNKSKNLNVDISQIPQDLFRHFLRGMWDGDGSISINRKNTKKPLPSMNITSSMEMCKKINDFFIKNIEGYVEHIYLRNKNKVETQTIIVCGKNNISQCLQLLYKDATIYMDRKYKKYLEIKDIYQLTNSND